ncbi:MAG TPA: two-component regulator propeller domain-containing protein, partial [Niastella sp.]
MRFFLFAILLWVLCPLAVFSQEYGYTRYDSKDGLASSTVYCMTQDKDGFMWFGTETGLSRFDGTHFRNFTQEDGLPDNEVIQLFADSKGRVWISPFKKTICYYYKGKIYNQENDSMLKQIRVYGNVVRFAEDDQKNVLLMETNQLHLVSANNEVHSINKIHGDSLQYLAAVSRNPAGGFWVVESNRLFEFSNRLFTLEKTIDLVQAHYGYASISDKVMAIRNNEKHTTLTSFVTQKSIHLPTFLWQTNFSIIDDDHVGVSSPDGAVVYNLKNPDSIQYFLKGVRVCGIRKDKEGNIWFTTLGQGVYRLNSAFVLNTKPRDYNTSHQTLSLTRFDQSILVGSDMNIIYKLNASTGMPEKEKIIPHKGQVDPVISIFVNSEHKIVYGGNMGISTNSHTNTWRHAIKHICVKSLYPHKNDLLVVTDRNIIRINPLTCTIKDTIWHERATTVFATNDTFYIGTLNGLYRRFPNGSIQFMGEQNASFKNRIAAIARDSNNVVWIATFGVGMIAYKNEKVIAHINERKGLTSNICRAIYLQGNSLWVGTNKGLNKIRLDDTTYPVKKYTTGDGLASDIINVLYVDKSKVFVGTPEGVTFFDEEKIASRSRCDLKFIDITIGAQTWYPDYAPVTISHENNSIQFNYVGISFKSNGDIRYRYRLLGLDSTWKETRETFLSYPALPSGDYLLQLQAINKFDVRSRMLTAGFTIEKLWYEKTGFRILIGLLFLAATGMLIWVISRRIRKREQEKTAISKRIGELEQLSRKAQMNPHFIFNSLNSIQQYVMDADVAGANKFIAGFSRLIRQTLDFSSKPEISMEEELDYLTKYLDIEKTRLENAFSWSV